MKFAIFDLNGLPSAFYAEDVWGPKEIPIYGDPDENGERPKIGTEPNPHYKIPPEAIEISEAQWRDFIENPGLRKWIGGTVVEFVPEPPPATLADYKAAFDAHLDTVAQSKSYDNRISIGTYATSTNTAYVAEAQAFIEWRDAALASMFNQLAAVEAGGVAPTVEEFIAALPVIVWP